jgi:hypothetical protein
MAMEHWLPEEAKLTAEYPKDSATWNSSPLLISSKWTIRGRLKAISKF